MYDPALLVPDEPPISFVTAPSLMLFSIAETTTAASCSLIWPGSREHDFRRKGTQANR
jgi:hypothetical protein